MRRPSVHRVEWHPDHAIYMRTVGAPGYGRAPVVGMRYRTRCGITGGAELLKLDGIDSGAGRWCGGCYPEAKPQRRGRAVPESPWVARRD